MKLLFVHDRLGALGGAEANALISAVELIKRGHSIGLVHGPGTGVGEANWCETFQERFSIDPEARALSVGNAVHAFEPDLIYVHNMSDLEVLETLFATGLPIVRMVHDHSLYCMRSYKYHPLTRSICKRPASLSCLVPCGAFLARNRAGGFPLRWVSYAAKRQEIQINRRFNRLVVATEYMRQEMVRNGFQVDKVEIHPEVPRMADGIPVSSFSGRNLILYVGQIIRGKGVDVLLKSLACVRDPFECVIVGDGHHKQFCETLSQRLGLGQRVSFTGFVPQEQLRRYFCEASVLVLSSVWPEPFGAVGVEGMRHGLPVVAFDAGGIREWLEDGQTGYLVPWMDQHRFSACLEFLLRNKDIGRRMGEQGRRWAAERYNFPQYINGLENMFERVMAETHRVPGG